MNPLSLWPTMLWLLIFVANAAPLAGARLPWAGPPLDLGLRLSDGRRLFGDHKRWLGVALAVMATAAAARLLHIPVTTGVAVALWAMAGDAAASLIKRRLAIPLGASVPGLDQLPESLLPLVFVGRPALSWAMVAGLAAAFMAADLVLRLLSSRVRAKG